MIPKKAYPRNLAGVLLGGALLVCLALVYLTLASNASSSGTLQGLSEIYVDSESYNVGDRVLIYLNTSYEEKELFISVDDTTYKYAGSLSPEVEFTPFSEGEYSVRLVDRGDGSFALTGFKVVLKSPDQTCSGCQPPQAIGADSIIWTDKTRYLLGEAVIIRVNGTLKKLVMELGYENRTYLGSYAADIMFIPAKAGDYSIMAVLLDDTIVRRQFSVVTAAETAGGGIGEDDGSINQEGEGITPPTEPYLSFKGDSNKSITFETRVFRDNSTSADIHVLLEEGPVDSIMFHGLKKGGSAPGLKIKDSPENIAALKDKKVVKAYAIDPSAVEFESAIVTAKATGTDLYKCRNWSYENGICLGEWEWLMDLVPGKDYSFELGPADPGFAETGVATVNTDKPVYHPGEAAELTLVVLDNGGYLTDDASVMLRISSPTNFSWVFNNSGGGLISQDTGIYSLLFNSTNETGYYSLEVDALGPSVNYTLISFFQVASFYEFDIIRDVAASIDPWKEVLNSSIQIRPYVNVSYFNFSEVIPLEFSVIDSGGATQTIAGGKKILTWTGLVNISGVSYLAILPLVSPMLYELGPSFVSYSNTTYYEARPWYLAIDPSPESLYMDSGQWSPSTGAALTSSELTDLNTSGGTGLLLDANGIDDFTGSIKNPTPNGTIETITQVHIIVVWTDVGGVDANEITVEGRDGSYSGTLFCSGTNAAGGGGTITVDCDAAHTFTPTELTNLNVNVVSSATGNEDARITYLHVDVVYTEANPPPNVTLIAPADYEWKTSRNVNFTFNVTSSDGVKNCSLWTNEGGWSQKELNKTGITLGGISWINDTFGSDGNYLWNIRCVDPSGAGAFASSNRTVRIDTTPPTVNLTKPAMNYYNDSSDPVTVIFNCSITDNVNSTNISLYITNNQNNSFAYADSCIITAQNGSCVWSKSLSNGNYTWNCLGYDHLGWSDWDINRSLRINSTISAPQVRQVQCMNTTSEWEACSNVLFNDTLRAIRVNCTDNDGSISNARFNLTNIPDSRKYFEGDATSNSGDWWYYDNSDVLINDSGEFWIETICWDDMALSTKNTTSWYVPWGHLVTTLVTPTSDTNVYKNEFFTFTARVECVGGECGDVRTTLDPLTTYRAASSAVTTVVSGETDVDEGTYTNTYAADCTGGTCTSANAWITGAADIGNSEPYTGESNATIGFNVSNISTNYIQNLTITWSGCWHGDQTAANNHCENGNNPEFRSGTGGGNFSMYIYDGTRYVQMECINNVGGECEAEDYIRLGTYTSAPSWGNADGYNTFKFRINDFNSSFVNNGQITLMWRTSGSLVWANGNSEDDILLVIDYASLELGWEYPQKTGAVSTAPGTEPFYTTDANPQNSTHESCLGGLIGGRSCDVSWQVNATGGINTTHEFYALFEMLTNPLYVSNNETSHIDITIVERTGDQPPIVTLNYPAPNNISASSTVMFNCSAYDDVGLSSMTLYGNFNGTFGPNGTNSISGQNTSTIFTRVLQDGIYFWNCLAYDNGGQSDWGDANRTLTVDTTKPNIAISSPIDGDNFTVSTIQFNFTVFDALDSTLLCNITLNNVVRDLNFNAPNSSMISRNITNIAQGYYYWNITCVDNAGNFNTSETRRFNVTDIVPNVTLVTRENLSQQSPIILLQYNATDNNGVIEAQLYINGQYNASNTSVVNGGINNFTVSGLEQGRYNWTVNVSDISNLTAQAPVKWFTIDWTKPSIRLIAPEMPYSTANSSVWFNFSASDNLDSELICNITVAGSVMDYDILAGNGSNIPRLITDLPDGVIYWNVTCADDAGNFNTSETWTFNVSEPPTVMLNSPPDNYSQNYTDIVLYYTPTDNYGFASCDLILNGAYDQSNSSGILNGAQNNFTLTGMTQGYYNWTVNCTDLVGNSVIALPVWRFTIDTDKPSIELKAPEPGQIIYGTNITFNYSVWDNLDSELICNLTLDGNVSANTDIISQNGSDTFFSMIMARDGVHWWNITCVDDAGNWNISETRNFTSLQPPTIELFNPIPDAVRDSGLDLIFRYVPYDTDGLTGSKLIIDGLVNQTNSTGLLNGEDNYFYLNITEDGVYYWSVNATDKNGLEGNSTTRKLTIDTTPPTIDYNYPTEGTVVDWNNVSFNFTVYDALDNDLNCDLLINGAVIFDDFNATNSSEMVLYYILQDGSYNWSLECYDHASWYNEVRVINFTVDAPPRVVLNSPIDYRTNSRNITFNYTPYDAIGFENCSIYINDLFVNYSSNIEENVPNYFNVSDLVDGDYNWSILCIDEDDLNPGWSSTENFSIDNTGPNIVLNAPGEGEGFNQNDITFNWTATDYTGTIIYCNMTLDGLQNLTDVYNYSGVPMVVEVEGLVFGDHNWSVTCVDDLGNTNTSYLGNFTINKPDLFISNTRVYLNNSNPDLNENITIFANVTNIGGNPANNVLVEFWNGLPEVGTLLGNATVESIGVNGSAVFNVSWIITAGYHTIWVVVDPDNIVSELEESNNNASLNISALSSRLNAPEHNSWYSNESVELNFTLTDYTGGSINYTIFVDRVSNGQTGSVTDAIDKLLNVTFTEGNHTVMVQATDALGRKKNSSTITIFVDLNAPIPRFETLNQTWFNDTTPEIFFNITDSIDAMLNYTLYVNGGIEMSGNISNATKASINLSERPEGVYVIVLEAFDDVMHYRNSTPLYIYIDTTPPSIRMDFPPNGYNFTSTVAEINFTAFDNMDEFLTCDLTVDNGVYRSSFEAQNNTMINTTVSVSGEGMHYWNVTCIDNATNTNTSETGYFYTWFKPHIALIAPENNNWTNQENQTFFFNVTDQTGITNCSLLFGGKVNTTKQGSEIINGGISNFSVNYLNGAYTWAVECYDNTSQLMYNVSANRTLYVDIVAPYPYIMTPNANWFNTSTPTIEFNITDNLAQLINYTFYVDGIRNANGSVNNATPDSASLVSISEGIHSVVLEGFDYVGNYRNSSPTTIFVDITKPSINLTYPANEFNSSSPNLEIRFIPTDNLAENLTCYLTIDSSMYGSYMNVSNNTEQSVWVTSQAPGYHYWNVTCLDYAQNRNTSETRWYFIDVPDLFVDVSSVFFNESNQVEDMVLTINATINNLGKGTAYNVTVQFFEGDWQNGTLIESNRTIPQLASGQNATLNVSYTAKIGTKWIYVVVDPPLAINGSIVESNESNNYARKSIFVGSYELLTGNLTGLLELFDYTNLSIMTWNVTNYTSSNIFAADSDSLIMWTDLIALGRNQSGAVNFDDFRQADMALYMENHTDSINISWTYNGQELYGTDWSIYGDTIGNVPSINSTNTSYFMTGILWDSSDPNTGGYTGTQDLVFVSSVNQGKEGKYGTYDYELRVPANLRKYLSPNNINSVTIYVELK